MIIPSTSSQNGMTTLQGLSTTTSTENDDDGDDSICSSHRTEEPTTTTTATPSTTNSNDGNDQKKTTTTTIDPSSSSSCQDGTPSSPILDRRLRFRRPRLTFPSLRRLPSVSLAPKMRMSTMSTTTTTTTTATSTTTTMRTTFMGRKNLQHSQLGSWTTKRMSHLFKRATQLNDKAVKLLERYHHHHEKQQQQQHQRRIPRLRSYSRKRHEEQQQEQIMTLARRSLIQALQCLQEDDYPERTNSESSTETLVVPYQNPKIEKYSCEALPCLSPASSSDDTASSSSSITSTVANNVDNNNTSSSSTTELPVISSSSRPPTMGNTQQVYDEGLDPFSAFRKSPPLDAEFASTDEHDKKLYLLGTILFNLAQLSWNNHNNKEEEVPNQLAMDYLHQAQKTVSGFVVIPSENSLTMAIHTKLGYLHYLQASGNHENMDPSEALQDYTIAFNMAKTLYGPNSLEAAACGNCLGVVYYAMCHHHSSSSSSSHNNSTTTNTNTASSTKYQEDSMNTLKQSLDIRRRLLGDEHQDTATTWNNLGRLYWQQGKYDDALTSYQHALKIRRQHALDGTVRGVDVAATIYNIGQVYQKTQECKKALIYFQEFMRMTRLHLGVDHRSSCTAAFAVAQVLHSTKDYSEALKAYKVALSICRQVFGPVSFDVVAIYNCIGNVYHEMGDLDEALCAFYEGLKVDTQLVDSDHHGYTYFTYSNVVEIHMQRSEFDQALQYAQDLLLLQKKNKRRRSSLDASLEMAVNVSTIARIHHRLGQYGQALEGNQECLQILQEITVDDDEDDRVDDNIASALLYAAMDLVKLGRSLMALEVLMEAYRIRKRLGKGEYSVEWACVTYHIADIHNRHGSHELALHYYRETAHIEQKVLGSTHRDLSITLYNIGQLHYQRGELDLSLQHFKQALSIEQEWFGKDHLTCARTWLEIGNVELQRGNIHGLMEAFSESFRIHQQQQQQQQQGNGGDNNRTPPTTTTTDENEFTVYGTELWRFEVIHPHAAAAA